MLKGQSKWGLLIAVSGAALWFGACSSETSSDTQSTASSSSASGAGGDASGAGGGGGATSSTASGLGGNFGAGGATLIPVRELDGLESITFYERTGGTEPTAYTFTINGPELTTRLDDPLDSVNHDIEGTSVEFYDVYYSDEDGVFDIDGSYLTISGVFPVALPAGGGLNLAEIGLNYVNAPVEFGNYLASYVVLGDNSNEMLVEACIDGDLQTHTVMGNTVGSTERLRLTLGFASTTGTPN